MSLPTGTVTLLLTDVEGSTQKWEAHAPQMREAMKRHHEIVHKAVELAGGFRPEEQGEGDSVVAAFARATDAIACALDIQRSLLAEPWPEGTPVSVRIGIHTGEIELRDERNYSGPAINRCARLRAIAHGGQTLVSLATRQLVRGSLPDGAYLRDLGPQRLKDLSQPEQVFQLCHPNLPEDFPPPLSMEVLPNNLPVQLTSFVGRDQEMAEVSKLILSSRLVTITGAAGCGKTRLALQIAADIVENFTDGVWFVDLAPVTDPALVPNTTSGALSVQEEPRRPILETLTDHLRPRKLLLIFDNCEHLLEACTALSAALLRACPKVEIVATSREPLGVAGETSWRVPSLAIPETDRPHSPEELMQFDSARLFVERALAGSPDFRLDRDECAAVGQICRRLDGIPLAIELAAAHTDVLTCEQIASMLDDQFRILTGGARTALERQQTMRAAVEWSYELLSESERTLLNRLSVFVGGFSLEGAEQICSGGPFDSEEVLGLLSSLVRKSLVSSERQPHVVRYRLLETIRQYSRDRLRESGEAAQVRIRHRDWHLDLAEKAEPLLYEGGRQAEWIARLEEEHDNLRAALEWSTSDEDPEPLARIGSALHRFWVYRGWGAEGKRWLIQALERSDRLPETLRAKALTAAGWLGWNQHDHKAAIPLLEEALVLRTKLGDDLGVAESLHAMGNILSSLGDYSSARAKWEESLEIRRRIGERRGAAAVLGNLAGFALGDGDFEGAKKSYQEVLAINREVGDRYNEAFVIRALGGISFQQDEYASARAHYEEALVIARELGARQLLAQTLGTLGIVAFTQGDYDAARAWWQEVADLAREAEEVWGEAVTRGYLAYLDGDYREGRELAVKAAAATRESGEKGSLTFCLTLAADCAEGVGDLEGSRAHLEEGLELSRSLGLGGERSELFRLGRLAQKEGDYERATALAREALPIAQKHRDRQCVAFSIQGLAAAAGATDDLDRSARLYGAAEGLLELIGAAIYPHILLEYQKSVEEFRSAAGPDAFDKSWAAGRELTLEEAVEFAMQV